MCVCNRCVKDLFKSGNYATNPAKKTQSKTRMPDDHHAFGLLISYRVGVLRDTKELSNLRVDENSLHLNTAPVEHDIIDDTKRQ